MNIPNSPAFCFKKKTRLCFKDKLKPYTTDNFEVKELIGEGSSARVYKGLFKNKTVCIKEYKCDPKSESSVRLIGEEAHTLSQIKHERIVKFLGISFNKMSIIMEYAEFVLKQENVKDDDGCIVHNLRQFIELVDLDVPMQQNFAFQIASAMKYLHSKDIVHCDLKAKNILLTNKAGKPFLKIGDFGLSKLSISTTNTATSSNRNQIDWGKGTLPFLAPEVLTDNVRPNIKRDVYAFGILLHEIVDPRWSFPWEEDVLYTNVNRIEQFVISGRRPKLPEDIDTAMSDIIIQCWSQDPSDRPTFDSVFIDLQKHLSPIVKRKIVPNLNNKSEEPLTKIPALDQPEPSLTKEDELMRWAGYAKKYMEIEDLRPFQVQSLLAWSEGKDTLIVHSTSSGKSVCFQLPALLNPHKTVLIIIPTTALAADQAAKMKSYGIHAEVFSADSSQTNFDGIFKQHTMPLPTAIIMTPEKLFGTGSSIGLIDHLKTVNDRTNAIHLIAVDEVHMMHQWGGSFRSAFEKITQLKDVFTTTPIMALTATLTTSFENRLITEVLRDPFVTKGTINRPNVDIQLQFYNPPLRGHKGEDWEELAIELKRIIGNETAIDYSSFANSCDPLCSALLEKGLTAASYTGKNKTPEEKKSIHDNMMKGDIQILVATEAYGLGINLGFIRWVFNIGVPQNMALWLQEMGRAGRDGKPATSILFFNEYNDIQRLKFWIKNTDSEKEQEIKYEFGDMLKYIYSSYLGKCVRKLQMEKFNDETDALCVPGRCCFGCSFLLGDVKDVTDIVGSVIQTLLFFEARGKRCLSESKITEWLFGEDDEKNSACWERMLGDNWKEVIAASDTFGALVSKQMVKKTMRIIYRQMIADNLLEQIFLESSPDGRRTIMSRFLAAKKTLCDLEEIINYPSIEYSSCLLSKPRIKPNTTNRPKEQLLPKIKMLLSNPSSWTELTRKEEYMFLGFYHNTDTLLYVENINSAPGKPIARNQNHFLWSDINLSKGQSHPQKTMSVDFETKATEVIIRRAPCNGVKICAAPGCEFAVSKKYHSNKCPQHEDAPLVDSGKCSGTFVYIYPLREADNRRWIGFLSTGMTSTHNHPCPSQSKAGSRLEEMIQTCIQNDPTKTPSELHKGYGLPCMPAAVNLIGASKQTISNIRKKYIVDYKEVASKNYIKKFDCLVKLPIDEKDNTELDEKTKQDLCDLVTPYKRSSLTLPNDDAEIILFMSPQMSSVLSASEFICVDVTYPDVLQYKYLLNVAAYNLHLLKWQVVSRIIMTRINSSTYTKAFELLFETCTKDHKEFQNGHSLSGIVVDFSDAQMNGIENALGQKKTAEVLRGCKVHWLRQAERQASKICGSDTEKHLFMKLCKALPDVEDISVAGAIFDVLSGDSNVSNISTWIPLSDEEIGLDIKKWRQSKNWTSWWRSSKHTRMFIKGATEMLHSTWDICPETTNAVESMNKISKPPSASIKSLLEKLYRVDRSVAYETLARAEGINVTETVLGKKRKASSKRVWRKQKGYRISDETNFDNQSQQILDDLLNKDILVETIGKKGKKYGFCKAKIIQKLEGDYHCKYYSWDSTYVIIPEEDLKNNNNDDIVFC